MLTGTEFNTCKISGPVTIGAATTQGILSPGLGSKPSKLTFSSTLTFMLSEVIDGMSIAR
jgi:hypothetical protein